MSLLQTPVGGVNHLIDGVSAIPNICKPMVIFEAHDHTLIEDTSTLLFIILVLNMCLLVCGLK